MEQAMITQQDLLSKLSPLVNEISTLECVKYIILFGSFARGDQNIASDVDIAVIHNSQTPGELRRQLSRSLCDSYCVTEDIQFTTIQEAVFKTDNHPLNVSHSIKKEGVVLWQR